MKNRMRALSGVVCLYVWIVCGANVVSAQTAPVLTSADIGAPVLSGAIYQSGGKMYIQAAGEGIGGTTDQFYFAYKAVSGDVDVRARVDSITAADEWSRAGVMIRASLAANAAHGYTLVSAAKGMAFQRRLATGATSSLTAGPFAAAPSWVRVVRKGSRVTSLTSPDGVTWTAIGAVDITLGQTAYVGLAVSSHEALVRTTASFSTLSVTPIVPFPAGVQNGDVGAPSIKGEASYSSGRYTVVAGGVDIGGTSDQFHYVYQQVSGDVDISARVLSITPADPWSKAGVMIRESLSAGSAHAMALVSSGAGFAFQRRPTAGGSSVHTSGGSGVAPGWVRLVRSGSRIDAFRSADGVQWTTIGSDYIPMGQDVYVGIAGTSHHVSVATSAVVESPKITVTAWAPTTEVPKAVGFQPQGDLSLITKYVLDIYAAGATPGVSTPVATAGLGKPAPDAAGEVVVDCSAFFAALAPGSYLATVTAVGSSGSARSASVAFTR